MTCYARHGFHGVTMADIAREAGVSPATLFTYFATKDELLAATLREASMRLILFVPTGGRRPDETLYGLLRRIWLGLAVNAAAERQAFYFWALFWNTPGMDRPTPVMPLSIFRSFDQVFVHLLACSPREGLGLLELLIMHWQWAVRWVLNHPEWTPQNPQGADALARAYDAWWSLTGLPQDTPFPKDFRPSEA